MIPPLAAGLRLHFEKQDLGQSRPEAERAGRGAIRRRRDRETQGGHVELFAG